MSRLLALFLLLAGGAQAEDRTAFAFTQRPGAAVPLATPLAAEDGASTSIRLLAAGRPTLLVLGYFHCPNLCGIVRDDVFNALSQIGLDASAYTVAVLSIDPRETPADAARARAAAMDRYAGAADAHFLTGPAQAIEEAVGFHSRYDDADGQFLHPAGLVLLTPGGAVSSYVLGVGYAPRDIEQAVRSAATGIIAAPADPILLLCFHYDPVTGRYSLAITKVLRLAAGLTTVGVVAALAVAHRRSGKRPA